MALEFVDRLYGINFTIHFYNGNTIAPNTVKLS